MNHTFELRCIDMTKPSAEVTELNQFMKRIFPMYSYNPFLKGCICIDRFSHIVGGILYKEHAGQIYISHVAVEESHRGQGIGSQLVQQVLITYPHQLIYLQVRSRNYVAIEMYKRAGFQQTKTQYGSWYFRPWDYAIRMERKPIQSIKIKEENKK